MRHALVVALTLMIGACGDNLKPACTADSDCGDGACADVACTDGTCVISNPIPQGQMAALQTSGDCRVAQCDGNGNVVEKNDDTDLPTTTAACSIGVCTNGVPSIGYAAADTTCGTGLICDDVGQCVGCISAGECPGNDTACALRTCVNNTCGAFDIKAGTKTATQTTGDCQDNVCDGSGSITTAEDDTDKPASASCTVGGCSAGAPTQTPKTQGTSCGSGMVCNATGVCGECNVADDCGTTTDCVTYSCTNNTCSDQDAISGTVTTAQTPGDCMQTQCDGSGSTMEAVDDSDLPVDGNACTDDVCTNGTPSNPPLADGTACTQTATAGTRCRTVAATPTCEPAVALVLVGDGTNALGTGSAPVTIEERYVSDGALVSETGNPLALLATASGGTGPGACTQAGTAPGAAALVQEGYASRSVDEHYVLLTCYDADPLTTAIQGTTSATVNRIVARIDATLTADTTTRFTTAFNTNGIRSAASTDGTNIWVGGAGATTTGGTWFTTFGTTDGGTNVTDVPPQNRCVEIWGGQLYGTSGAGNAGYQNVYAVGTGLATTSGQTSTALNGMPITGASNPQSYAFFDLDATVPGLDTLYVADDRASAAGGGVQKWTLDGTGTWSLEATFGGLTGGAGAHGLAAYVDGTNVVIVATVATNAGNDVVMYIDDGVSTPTPTTVVTAAADYGYHGVALTAH